MPTFQLKRYALQFFLALAILIAPFVIAQAQPQSAQPPSNKILRVGTSYFYPPYVITTANHEVFGFDIDLIRAVCKQLNRKCSFFPMLFTELPIAIEQNNVDIIIGAITVDAHRKKRFLFSTPYLPSYGTFLLQSKSPIKTLADIQGKTVGVHKGSLFDRLLNTRYKDKVTIKYFRTHYDLLKGLQAGKVDAILLDQPAANYWTTNSSGQFKELDPSLKLGSGIAIMASKANEKLIDSINQALVNIKKDGEFLQLYKRYFSVLPAK